MTDKPGFLKRRTTLQNAILEQCEEENVDSQNLVRLVSEDEETDSETVRRAVNEAVKFGALRKVATRAGRQTGELELTELGRWWLEVMSSRTLLERDPERQKEILEDHFQFLLNGFEIGGEGS